MESGKWKVEERRESTETEAFSTMLVGTLCFYTLNTLFVTYGRRKIATFVFSTSKHKAHLFRSLSTKGRNGDILLTDKASILARESVNHRVKAAREKISAYACCVLMLQT